MGKAELYKSFAGVSTTLCSAKATAGIPVSFIDLTDSGLGHLEFSFDLETCLFYPKFNRFK